MSTSATKTVLVVCTGNSCRSQMAEVLLSQYISGVRALSAGTHPEPNVSDNAITALQEDGLPTDKLHPKNIEAVMDEEIDLVVTLCDKARETSPVFPREAKVIHLSFHDPYGEPLDSFRAVRDDLKARLLPAVQQALGL